MELLMQQPRAIGMPPYAASARPRSGPCVKTLNEADVGHVPLCVCVSRDCRNRLPRPTRTRERRAEAVPAPDGAR